VLPALAQNLGVTSDMKALLKKGFDTKASAPNGNKFIALLQKDKDAYACEFTTLTLSRYSAINKESE